MKKQQAKYYKRHGEKIIFEGYFVDELGKVYGKSGKILKPKYNKKNGYQSYILIKDGKPYTCYAHRLILSSFTNDYNEEKYTVNHINENKTDNKLSNLEWMSNKENNNHGNHGKRIGEKNKKSLKNHPCRSRKIKCLETGIIYPSCSEAERQLGICHVACVLNGKRNHAGGYHFIEIK